MEDRQTVQGRAESSRVSRPVIHFSQGERCFESDKLAINPSWHCLDSRGKKRGEMRQRGARTFASPALMAGGLFRQQQQSNRTRLLLVKTEDRNIVVQVQLGCFFDWCKWSKCCEFGLGGGTLELPVCGHTRDYHSFTYFQTYQVLQPHVLF